MGFTFEWFNIDSSGLIQNSTIIDNSVIRKFSLECNAGDEYKIRNGDLVLEHKNQLPKTGSSRWVAVWFDDFLIDVFYQPWNGFEEYDYKAGIYKSRLPSFQQIVFENLSKIYIGYSTDTDTYNYYLPNAAVIVDKLKMKPGLYLSNAYVFSPIDMLRECIALSGAKNGLNFSFNGMTVDGDIPSIQDLDNDVCAIWRGTSSATFQTAADKLGNGQLTWFNIIELIQFLYNCFIHISANITISPRYLNGGIRVTPRINFTPGGGYAQEEIRYTELKKVLKKYKIDGVRISGSNFEYLQGATYGSIFEKSFDIYDPDDTTDVTQNESRLFWADADYDSGIGKYKILDASNNNKPYSTSGLLLPYYAGLITSGDGFEGSFVYELIYNGNVLVRVLNLLEIYTQIALINRLVVDQDNVASFDAIII